MKKLIIADNKNGYLSFDLRDILKLIDIDKYLWNVKDIDINYIESETLVMSETDYQLFESIMKLDNYPISWNELMRLSNLNIQFINGKIRGQKNNEFIELLCFDSSYWLVETNSTNLLNKIQANFKDTKYLEV